MYRLKTLLEEIDLYHFVRHDGDTDVFIHGVPFCPPGRGISLLPRPFGGLEFPPIYLFIYFYFNHLTRSSLFFLVTDFQRHEPSDDQLIRIKRAFEPLVIDQKNSVFIILFFLLLRVCVIALCVVMNSGFSVTN